jgi:hypothetical protein
VRRVRGIDVAGLGRRIVHLSGEFLRKGGKIFFVKRRRPWPRREGQGPGWLPGKINEYSLLQPLLLLEGMQGGVASCR